MLKVEKKLVGAPESVDAKGELLKNLQDYKKQFEKFLKEYFVDEIQILSPEFYEKKIVKLVKDKFGKMTYEYDIPKHFQKAYYSKLRGAWFNYIKILSKSFSKVLRFPKIKSGLVLLFKDLETHDRKYADLKKSFMELSFGKKIRDRDAFNKEWKAMRESKIFKAYLVERKKLIKRADALLEEMIKEIKLFIKTNN